MRRGSTIVDEIEEYLDLEMRMGTQWIPIGGKGGAPRGGEMRGKERHSGGSAVSCYSAPGQFAEGRSGGGDVRPLWSENRREPAGLATIWPPLSTHDEEEKRRRIVALREVEVQLKTCTRCALHTSRTNSVLHDGSPVARLCFVGEGPGAEEDASGIPFVGRAGRLLTKIVEAMGLRRQDVYICNVVKCRPPGNRTPSRQEMEACWPYLEKQLEIVRPECIVALGLPAAQMLVRGIVSISNRRGQWIEYRRIPVMLTYHPAYLLRNPDAKRLVWEDMKKVHELLTKGRVGTPLPYLTPQEKGQSLSLFEGMVSSDARGSHSAGRSSE